MNRTSRRHKFLLITGIISAGAIALAGCSSSATSSASGSASAKPRKVTLTIYAAQGYDKAAVAAFQKATGIPVKLDDNSTGPLLTQ
ncbi:MAG: extracellular solute-binding protein family 1, partial [Actinomycetia bacterium]|nr:extracellular solute-binding protein family 1 [Actinomycetes bacterium]